MKKELSLYHLCVASIFVCILLTCTLFYGINALICREGAKASACYDGTVIEQGGFVGDFNRSVYQNATMRRRILEHQYRFFGIMSHPNVLAGDDDFLFDVYDEETGYNYLDDYLGELQFSAEECEAILTLLEKRRDSYAERGAEYLLVILPNAQSVYSENMPDYLGSIRRTRLEGLENYLYANKFTSFVNLTDELIAYKSEGRLYNNTENTLNSLGLYYTYRCVCERFEPTIMAKTRVIPRNDLNLYYHLTTGKAVARRAGLADVVSNLTASLSNNTKLNYHSTPLTGRVTQTVLLPFEIPNAAETPRLLLQFSSAWERWQSEPFFANTFRAGTYQTDHVDDDAIFSQAQPQAVIQFLYENQLSWLLPQ